MDVQSISDVKSDKGRVLGHMIEMGHEQVLFCHDAKSGLKAIIAVHSTVCGPSLGGTRMWQYENEGGPLRCVEVVKRVTYKNSISGLNLGGGKAVIMEIQEKISQKSSSNVLDSLSIV